MTAPLTTRDVLIAARALIARPEAWTKNAFARDAQGRATCDARAEDAVCFCMGGAIARAIPGEAMRYDDSDAYRALCVASGLSAGAAVSSFNDRPSTDHASVLAAFDKAIAEVSS